MAAGRTAAAVFLALSAFTGALQAAEKADLVVVEKSESRLYLLRDGEVFASYGVTFGSDPEGHKGQQGDGRTPEGTYTLDFKQANSSFYKAIHVSYPDAKDREAARALGVNAGGDIMVHGQPNGWGWLAPVFQLFNWTDGCIALTDADMERVWSAVDAGTPIEIRP